MIIILDDGRDYVIAVCAVSGRELATPPRRVQGRAEVRNHVQSSPPGQGLHAAPGPKESPHAHQE